MKDPNPNQTMPPAVTETAVRKPIQRWSAARISHTSTLDPAVGPTLVERNEPRRE
jgi:hypothetical protein